MFKNYWAPGGPCIGHANAGDTVLSFIREGPHVEEHLKTPITAVEPVL